MKNIVIRIPSYSVGNIGDLALIKTIKNVSSDINLIIPSSEKELNSVSINEIDCLIYFGNDCIGYYGISKEIINKFLSNNKKVFIINTSWGNDTKKDNMQFIKSISNNSNFQIYMRDIYSNETIQQQIKFLNTPKLTADLAFICNINENNKIDSLERWVNNNDKPIIGINIHEDFKELNKSVFIEIQTFISKNSNYRYLFIPHDSRKNEYNYLQKLYNLIKNIDGFVCNYLDPEYEKFITNKLFLVITGRMHLSILTIPNSIPCIAISYNGLKAKGSFQHWGIEELVIEPKNIKNIHEKFEYIVNNYIDIQNTINNKRQDVYSLIYNMIAEINLI